MAKTNIEYGERNWNFYPGCNGPDGTPCPYCWSRNRVLPRMKCPECRTLKPHFHHERMREPLHVKKPTRWLVCYTGDLFGSWVSNEIRAIAFEIMRTCPQHTFLTLTKQPQNLAKWGPFPLNCWVGATATDPHTLIKGLWHMNKVEAKVKYLSLEPLLDWAAVLPPDISYLEKNLRDMGISWLIIGAQTKPFVAPEIAWVREIVQAADKAGIKVFLKNSLYPILNDTLPEIDFDHKPLLFWRHDGFQYQLRQEMPECKPV